MLLDHAVTHGAVARQNASATLLESSADGCRIGVTGHDSTAQLTARVVIVADGLAGTFLPRDGQWESRAANNSHFGVGARLEAGLAQSLCEPGVIAMHCGGAGYFGAVRLGDGSVDIAAALSPEQTRKFGGPGRTIRQLACEAGSEAHADLLAQARWRGTPLLTRRRQVEGENIFVVGDAAGYVEPFTGEGMSWGLAAGLAVARHAKAALAHVYKDGEWTREWKQLAERRRAACRATALALRSPTLIAASISLANTIPAAANLFSSVISGPWRFGGSETAHA